METLFGIVGKDFILTAADQNAGRSILLYKSSEDKTRDLTPKMTMLFSGEPGDTVNFAEYIQKNVRLYAMRNNFELSPSAAANFVRRELATSIRSRHPYAVNVLIAGYDEIDGPELYWLDYLGTLHKVPYGAHGHASSFIMATIDQAYEKDLSLEQAIEIMRKAIHVVQNRIIISQPNFMIKLVDANGVREIEI